MKYLFMDAYHGKKKKKDKICTMMRIRIVGYHGKPRMRMKKCTMREREMRVFMVTNQLKALAVDCFTIASTRAAWRNIKNTPAESKLSLGCSLYC